MIVGENDDDDDVWCMIMYDVLTMVIMIMCDDYNMMYNDDAGWWCKIIMKMILYNVWYLFFMIRIWVYMMYDVWCRMNDDLEVCMLMYDDYVV